MTPQQSYKRLTEILAEIQDLKRAGNVLAWDQFTHMPPQGSAMRGRQLATLGKIAHDMFTSKEVEDLLGAVQAFEKSLDHTSDDACLLANVRRDYEKATKLPSHFVSTLMTHQSQCYDVWVQARAENSFTKVAPYLAKTLELSQQYAQYFKYNHIADPLIATSDEGFTTQTLRGLFGDLKKQLVPLLQEVVAKQKADDSLLKQSFPLAAQEQFSKDLVAAVGYDFTRGRLDTTHHPFMISFAHGDVRITTRYQEHNLSESIFSALHEMGHAFYEMGIAKELDGTLLFDGASSGVHESQSRLWENIVGRSMNFWTFFYPKLVAAFPTQLSGVSLSSFHSAINKVAPSLIRTDACELSYNLHVMIRFELEIQMLEGYLDIKDLPEAWNAAYEKDLGMRPPSDAMGCMQDVHWYGGLIGGQFQGYTLGNIMAAQFYEAALKDLPHLPDDFKQGQFKNLKQWLGSHLHRHGRKFLGLDVLKKATGHTLDIHPYLNYLTGKFLYILE